MYLFLIQEWYKVFGVVVADVIDPYGGTIHVKVVGGGITTNDAVHLRQKEKREGGERGNEGRGGGGVVRWLCW